MTLKNKIITVVFLGLTCMTTMHQLHGQETSWLKKIPTTLSAGLSNGWKIHGDKMIMATLGAGIHYALANLVYYKAKSTIEHDKGSRKRLAAVWAQNFQSPCNLRIKKAEPYTIATVSHTLLILPMTLLVSPLVQNRYFTLGTLGAWVYGMHSNCEKALAIILDKSNIYEEAEEISGADTPQKDFEDAACENNLKKMQNLLTTQQSHIDVKGKKAWTFSPLMFAVAHQNLDMVNWLIEKKAIDINAQKSKSALNNIISLAEELHKKCNNQTSNEILNIIRNAYNGAEGRADKPKENINDLVLRYSDEIRELLKTNCQIAREEFCNRHKDDLGPSGAHEIFIQTLKKIKQTMKIVQKRAVLKT